MMRNYLTGQKFLIFTKWDLQEAVHEENRFGGQKRGW